MQVVFQQEVSAVLSQSVRVLSHECWQFSQSLREAAGNEPSTVKPINSQRLSGLQVSIQISKCRTLSTDCMLEDTLVHKSKSQFNRQFNSLLLLLHCLLKQTHRQQTQFTHTNDKHTCHIPHSSWLVAGKVTGHFAYETLRLLDSSPTSPLH